jgi:acetyl esterase/lipase
MDAMKVFLLCLALPLLTACATHLGAPASTEPLPSPTTYRYSLTRDVIYTPQGWSQALGADVYAPQGAGPFPGVLLVHGGGWVGGKREDMDGLAVQLARRGYVVMNVSYRFAPAFRHPAQQHDLGMALAWLRDEAPRLRLDAARIGAWGYSAGAHLAALLGTGEPPARVRAVVAGGLPADLRSYPNSPLIKKLMGTERDADPDGWRAASPLPQVGPATAPFFLYHGTWDWVVGPRNARAMHAALQASEVPSELYLIRGYGHFATFLWHQGAIDAALEFLDRELR